MYRRRTGCGRYVPARNAAPSSPRNDSTPRCSISASVSESTPAEPRFRLTRRHASRRTSSLQIRSIRAWKRRFGDRLAAAHRRRCNWRTLSRGTRLPGELGPGSPAMPSRVLATTPCPPQGPFPPAAFCCTALRSVGSEEARPAGAGLRPPLKRYVRFSRIPLSRRRSRMVGTDGRNQTDKVDQAQLAVERGVRQGLPSPTPPPLVPMRPHATHHPAVELVEELPDVGAFVVVPPSPQDRVELLNQHLRGHWRGTA